MTVRSYRRLSTIARARRGMAKRANWEVVQRAKRGDRRADRGDDRILGGDAGRRHARDRLPRAASAGPRDEAARFRRRSRAATPSSGRSRSRSGGPTCSRRSGAPRPSMPRTTTRRSPGSCRASGWATRRSRPIRSAGSSGASRTSRRCSPRRATPSWPRRLDPDALRQAMPAILATIRTTLAFRPAASRGLTGDLGGPPRTAVRRLRVGVVGL